MSTPTSIAGITFDSYICNASGPLDTTREELEALGRSESSAIVMKSATIEPREGNITPRYIRLPFGSIQSMGLPNLGYHAYVGMTPALRKFGKPIVASVSGFSVLEYVTMVRAFQHSDVDLIEVNLSCPNIEGKSQVAYDVEQTEEVLDHLQGLGEKPLGLKLPPYFDPVHQRRMADLITQYAVSFITCTNSVGNTLVINPETETPVIAPKRGYGGLGGAFIKPIALANVRAFYELLHGTVSIFGVGGITNGTDAFEFLLAGADAVQIGTTFEKEGIACFARIQHELDAIMERKGYHSTDEVKGKLKYL